jgi:phage pi2 protein 07
MGSILQVNFEVDENEVRRMYSEKIAEAIKEADYELVFWDSAELKRRTCLSWNTIQDSFFFDPRFPKRKIGNKWYFPVRETRKFLETWLQEQPKS